MSWRFLPRVSGTKSSIGMVKLQRAEVIMYGADWLIVPWKILMHCYDPFTCRVYRIYSPKRELSWSQPCRHWHRLWCGAASDDKVGIMTSLGFQRLHFSSFINIKPPDFVEIDPQERQILFSHIVNMADDDPGDEMRPKTGKLLPHMVTKNIYFTTYSLSLPQLRHISLTEISYTATDMGHG